jgi:hypothetical protein
MNKLVKFETKFYNILLIVYSIIHLISVIFHILNTGDTSSDGSIKNWSKLGDISENIMLALFLIIIGLIFISFVVWLIYFIYRLKYKNILLIFSYILVASLLGFFPIVFILSAPNPDPYHNFHMIFLTSIVIINVLLRNKLFKTINITND